MRTQLHFRSYARGIGLIEALVSLLVLALGMMSFAALQARLRLNSDVAKQRSEAVRLAQEDTENFRALGTLGADGTITNNFAYSGITAGATTRTISGSNATFTLTRTVADAPRASGITDASMKNLVTTVTWTDRTGASQSVILRSMIARADPAVAASLALPANGSPLRDLLGRDIQVPIPAKNLGDGTSAVKPLAGGDVAYVFSNDSGLVTRRCQGGAIGSTSTSGLTTGILAGTCTDIPGGAYLVSGFIRTSLASTPDATNPNDLAPGPMAMRVDFDSSPPPTGTQGTAQQLTATYWSSRVTTATGAVGETIGSGPTYAAAECNAEATQTVRYTRPVSYTQTNNGNTTTVTSTTEVALIPQSVTSITPATVAPYVGLPASDVQSPTAIGERFVAYTCLVYPIDLDGNASTRAAYTARVTIWPVSGWNLGTGSSDYKVCRYSADYNLNGGQSVVSGSNVTSIDNQEHPYAYLNAQRSLSNQNYLIIRGNRSCPTDSGVEVDGQGGENYTDETTVTHQP